MFSRNFIRKNIITTSILLFIIIFGIINFMTPSFLYNNDGSLRQFGLNSSKKTILPSWLLAILISILSYFIVLYYLAAPKLLM